MNFLARTLFRTQSVRRYADQIKVHPKAKKIKELQRKFTVDDGVPVYLKGGSKDKILYQISLAGVATGLLMAIHVLYSLIVPGANPPPKLPGEDQQEANVVEEGSKC